MAGGTFLGQNKIRPGAYINFKSVPKPSILVGNRGIATIPLSLDWGDTEKLIDVYSTEFSDGTSLSKIGFTATDEKENKLLKQVLANCYLAKVFNLNINSVKATKTTNDFTITAKYGGVLGNKIIVTIVAKGTLFEVSTYLKGSLMDKQIVATISELEPNDYVEFSGTGNLTVNPGLILENGSNGTATETLAYPKYFNLAKMSKWQVMALPTSTDAIKETAVTFVNNLRNNEGKYTQIVLADYSGADNEGIINVLNGVNINNVNYSKEEITSYVAGITAGADITTSNTGKTVLGGMQIIGELTDTEIDNALQTGKFVFSTKQNGDIQVTQDINSLHTFTPELNYEFSKNRVLRTLDEIGISIKNTWENIYLGKVNNDDIGRNLFRGDIIAYLTTLQNLGAIQNFKTEDVKIKSGTAIDSVLADIFIQPVDSMEKLYMTINVTA